MYDLPQRSLRHSSGERGLAILKLKLPQAWICRNQPESDYGIDVEIEIADEKVRGIILKGQVRTKTPINWAKNDTFREPFSSGKLLYWRTLGLPVVLFLVDNQEEKVYWQEVSNVAPADSTLSEGVVVAKHRELQATIKELTEYVTTFRSFESALKSVNRLHSHPTTRGRELSSL